MSSYVNVIKKDMIELATLWEHQRSHRVIKKNQN